MRMKNRHGSLIANPRRRVAAALASAVVGALLLAGAPLAPPALGAAVAAPPRLAPQNGKFLSTALAAPQETEQEQIAGLEIRNVRTVSAYMTTSIDPEGLETEWRWEYAQSAEGPWSPVPGGGGTISQARAEAQRESFGVGVRLSGLSAATTYYVRIHEKNAAGSFTSLSVSFTTEGPPSVALGAHGLVGETPRLLGTVTLHSTTTTAEQLITVEGAPNGGTFTLTFDGQSTGWTGIATTTEGSDEVSAIVPVSGTAVRGELVSGPGIPPGTTVVEPRGPQSERLVLSQAASASATGVSLTAQLPYNAGSETVRHALEYLPAGPELGVEGPEGGPYTVWFIGSDSEVSEPPIECAAFGLEPPTATCSFTTTQQGGEAYGTHSRFQYVSEKSFLEHGWADAEESPELGAGPVGYSLPGASAGESYHYRIVAQTNAPGTSLVESPEETLKVPVPPPAVKEACANEAFRTGLSAHLPDCRAYEQLTPVDKEGAQEPFVYGAELSAWTLAGEDGNHLVLGAEGVDWGSGPTAGQSPYLFSREDGKWGMRATLTQPESGVHRDYAQVFSSNLTQVAFESEYQTSYAGRSAELEYKVGPVGGPYTTAASVPRNGAEFGENGWVDGDAGLSKLVLAVKDRTLLGGEPTGTKSGTDLYEYTAQGGLAQLNVSGEPAATIGACGAELVRGKEDDDGAEGIGLRSSPRSISADGSRIFFTAVPGRKCNEETPNLYERVDGSETVDIGAWRFLAANADGTTLLLQAESGAHETVLYDTESKSTTPLPGMPVFARSDYEVFVSADLSVAYYQSGGGLYRYEFAAGKPEFLMAADPTGMTITPNGNEVYLEGGGVGGMPAKGIYRYDSTENVVQCISCASPFDPEPKQPAFLHGVDGYPLLNGGALSKSSIAADGDYAFFTTPAALVPQDVDGEIPIEGAVEGLEKGTEFGDVANQTSPSSDIYEWRRAGVNGCAQVQGCVALITNGRGGYKNLLIGTAEDGRDVFVYTREKLLPQDNDEAGDIYDARIDGGFPPPPTAPTECEGDACSTPAGAPEDSTPPSMTFDGAGNVMTSTGSNGSGSTAKSKCAKDEKLTHGRCVKRKTKGKARKARRAARRAARAKSPARRVK